MAEYIERTDALAIVDLHHGPMLAYHKIRSLPAADVAPVVRWISVEDSLPEDGKYIVYVKTQNKYGGYVSVGWFSNRYEGVDPTMNGKRMWHDYDSEWGAYELRNVTHWMPLPEPPHCGAKMDGGKHETD